MMELENEAHSAVSHPREFVSVHLRYIPPSEQDGPGGRVIERT